MADGFHLFTPAQAAAYTGYNGHYCKLYANITKGEARIMVLRARALKATDLAADAGPLSGRVVDEQVTRGSMPLIFWLLGAGPYATDRPRARL